MFCPFCETSTVRFLPSGLDYPILETLRVVGGGRRPFARCPTCLSVDRERLVLLFIRKRCLIKKASTVLHVGPEHCLGSFLRTANIRYVSTDLDASIRRVSVVMDLVQLGFRSAQFDCVICNHVLEHVPDDHAAMKELYRILVPGGWGILQVPFSPILNHTLEDPQMTTADERIQAFGQRDHVRLYGTDYVDRLAACGFTVESISVETAFSKLEISGFSLNPAEKVFLARKPI
jgi:SAM-dependent methyltransferase